MLQLGNLLVEAGKLTEAREKFCRVIEQEPTETEAYLRLGELSLADGNLEAAAAEFEMAGRLNADRPGVNLCLAKVAKRRRNNALTQAYLLAELERTGRSVAQSLQLAHMLLELNMPRHASRALDPLLEHTADQQTIDPDQLANALFLKGLALNLVGYTQAGIIHRRRAVRLKPKYFAAIHSLITTHLDNRQIRHAAYWFNRARQLDPQNVQLRPLHQQLIRAAAAASARRVIQKLKSKLLWWPQAR